MKTSLSLLTATSLLFAASHLSAQRTGTSHPQDLGPITTQQPVAPVQAPVQPPAPAAATQPAPVLQVRTPPVSSAPITYTAGEGDGSAVDVAPPASATQPAAVVADDVNSGVVILVPSAPNQLPTGTMIRVMLPQTISTRDPELDVMFQANVTNPVVHDGHIVIPAGSVLTGRITELSSGHHIGHAASIHLRPDYITLPNGTHYKLDAQVTDLSYDHRTRISDEGTIIGNDPTPGTETTVAVSTGAGAATGALLGGGVGAVVGAGIGAGVGGSIWAKQHTSETLPRGTQIIFSLNQPMLLENTNAVD